MQMMKKTRAAWIDIDLDKIKSNYRKVMETVNGDAGHEVIPMLVVKAQAYGHGTYEIARVLGEEGVEWMAAATYSEALIAKAAAPGAKVLVFGYIPEDIYDEFIEQDLRMTIFSLGQAKALSAAASRLGKTAHVHIKLDTGMHRMGFQVSEQSCEEIKQVTELPYIDAEAMYTHFATSELADKTFVHVQHDRFVKMVSMLEEAGVDIPLKHISNGGIIIDSPEYNKDMVRLGCVLYATFSNDEVRKDRIFSETAFELRSDVVTVREVGEGEGISYGLKYVTERPSRIATLSLGYADMDLAGFSNGGYVLIRGKRAPVVGSVCMDQMMVDVTDIEDVRPGETATLIGRDGDEEITVQQAADLAGLDDYELLVTAQMRLPKRYWENGEICSVEDPSYVLAMHYMGKDR